VNQNNLIFETLWNKAIPVEKRIREIEKGLLPTETYLIDNQTKALSYAQDFIQNADTGFSNSTSIGYFKLLNHNKILLQSYLQYLSKYQEGKVKGGIRWVTHIENKKENVELIRKFLDVGIEIKHVRSLPPLYFSVSQKQCVVTIENLPNGEMFQKIIHSSEPSYILHYQTIFKELWNTGINAQERIRQIEAGIILGTTRIIENPVRTKQYFIDLVRNSKEEVLILFPSHNAVKREVIMGIIDLLKKKSAENIGIRILSPVNQIIKQLLFPMDVNDKYEGTENIRSREIRKQDNLISTIVIVDRKYVLATELKDDSKEFFEEAIGESTYTTSKPTVLSYISIFESLWDQTEMYDSLKIANQKLIQSEQTEREFINTAAHELRTPTQAIMGYTEIDKEVFNDLLENPRVTTDEELKRIVNYLKRHFDAVSRNSTRLDELINNLLDVARIESNRINRLQIHKQKLDIVIAVNDTIKTELEQKIRQKNIKINFINELPDEKYWVYADKLRLSQIMNNLIGNAIKFSHQNGRIDIIVKENFLNSHNRDLGEADNILKNNNNTEIQEKKEDNGFKDEILVGITDTGKGISHKVMPKLFEKFITSSDTGTGLGLYITRNLVEAHGGKIWAYNNKDDIGSTFVFSLPKADDKILDSD
jgi:signal transduction histidine kinase